MDQRAEMRRARDGVLHAVILANLSRSGARITTPAHLARGEEVTLTIDAGKQPPFTLGCKIVTAARAGGSLHFDYGLQFIAVRPGEEARLRTFVGLRGDARFAGDALI